MNLRPTDLNFSHKKNCDIYMTNKSVLFLENPIDFYLFLEIKFSTLLISKEEWILCYYYLFVISSKRSWVFTEPHVMYK